MKNLQQSLQAATQQHLGLPNVEIELSRPDEQFGDFTTNVALKLAKEVGESPRDLAARLAEVYQQALGDQLREVSIAGPGFINLRLADNALLSQLEATVPQTNQGQEILVEFGDPNPFKAMHLGHLYSTIVGDTMARLLEATGATAIRLGYHGDVGLHVARAMWALLQYDGDIAEVLDSEVKIGEFYAKGAAAHRDDPAAKQQIEAINRQVYELRLQGALSNDTTNGRFAEIYQLGFARSFAGFDAVFKRLGVDYKRHYLESESTKAGQTYVQDNIGKVFEESEGAIIYRGEKVGLHTRVFINSQGLPTYEAKDLGLTELKNKDYPNANASIIITAHEQSEYFKVMLAALSEIDPTVAAKTRHVAHGLLSISSGKMGSRHGIKTEQVAANLMDAVQAAVTAEFSNSTPDVQEAVYLAALRYTFLKNRVGNDVVFNVEESVALTGNSGPYLQYAHARARSILSKAKAQEAPLGNLEPAERSLVRKMAEFPEVVSLASHELMPHHICTYLYELAQSFNRFYEHNRVIGDSRESQRLTLVRTYADTLKKGLGLLGITAPDRM